MTALSGTHPWWLPSPRLHWGPLKGRDAVPEEMGWLRTRRDRFAKWMAPKLFGPGEEGERKFWIAFSISIAAVIGLGLATAAICSFTWWCSGTAQFGVLCTALKRSPPWIALTFVAGAPAALTTWYWRTEHKKADIAHTASELKNRREELEQRNKEIEQRDAELGSAKDTQLAQRFSEAVKLLEGGGFYQTIGGMYALERIARDSADDTSMVLNTLAGFVRHNSNEEPRIPGHEHILDRELQTALDVFGRIARRGVPAHLSFHGSMLKTKSFVGGDFSRVDFSACWLTHADFSAANISHAKFDTVAGHGEEDMFYDDRTKFANDAERQEFENHGGVHELAHRAWRLKNEWMELAKELGAKNLEPPARLLGLKFDYATTNREEFERALEEVGDAKSQFTMGLLADQLRNAIEAEKEKAPPKEE